MNKIDLEQKVVELETIVNNQKHLAKAIEVKDAEIAKLNSLVNELKKLESVVSEQKHLAKAVEAKDAEIHKLNELVRKLKESHAEQLKDLHTKQDEIVSEQNKQIETLTGKIKGSEKLEVIAKQLQTENQRLIAFVNQYTNVFKGVLKTFQGALDNSIELEAILMEKIQNKGDK